ncbi:MAG: aldo/keto reductase [Lachnospiraceae bacterium]|nr:aldo/keto reductase [Lachnospiraceae bacterium]
MNIKTMPKLGFGMMRLPMKNGEIDMEQVNKMVDCYMEHGYNYFDTAYVYHGGESEKVVKKALTERYPREAFTVATKLPAWALSTKEDRDRVFNEQLARTGLSYIDYYLLHSLEDGNNYRVYEELDCFRWGMEKKAAGLIKHLGFSFHGTPELLKKVLDDHPEIEFVQIQVNYADWDNKVVHSGELYEILLERNIPMIIMEPVKGGTLANMAPALMDMFKAARPDASVASWAMRFVGSLPGIATILSGMSDESQLADNLKTFDNFEPLSDEEQALIKEVVKKMLDIPLIPCTSCRYCVDGCPMGIQIPDIFNAVNTKRKFPGDNRPGFYYNSLTGYSGKASDCVGCGQCEGVCPQHLEITELLKEAAAVFER